MLQVVKRMSAEILTSTMRNPGLGGGYGRGFRSSIESLSPKTARLVARLPISASLFSAAGLIGGPPHSSLSPFYLPSEGSSTHRSPLGGYRRLPPMFGSNSSQQTVSAEEIYLSFDFAHLERDLEALEEELDLEYARMLRRDDIANEGDDEDGYSEDDRTDARVVARQLDSVSDWESDFDFESSPSGSGTRTPFTEEEEEGRRIALAELKAAIAIPISSPRFPPARPILRFSPAPQAQPMAKDGRVAPSIFSPPSPTRSTMINLHSSFRPKPRLPQVFHLPQSAQ